MRCGLFGCFITVVIEATTALEVAVGSDCMQLLLRLLLELLLVVLVLLHSRHYYIIINYYDSKNIKMRFITII